MTACVTHLLYRVESENIGSSRSCGLVAAHILRLLCYKRFSGSVKGWPNLTGDIAATGRAQAYPASGRGFLPVEIILSAYLVYPNEILRDDL